MRTKDCISRCLHIVRRLKRGQRATFNEIQHHLDDASILSGENYSISIRTFQRDLEVIRELFLIDIQYSRSEGVYYICDETTDEMLSERLIESLEVFHSLQMVDNLSRVFHFEQRAPLGTEHLSRMISAIKNHNTIALVYNKNWSNQFTERTVIPLLLKEFRGRWYVVAKRIDTEELRTYSLDRIIGFTINNQHSMSSDNMDDYFYHSFGIYGESNPQPQEVVLRFSHDAGLYIKEAVIHHSQEVISDTCDEFTIRLNLLLTFDFTMEILAYGDYVEVLSPPELRSQVAERLKKAAKIYQ